MVFPGIQGQTSQIQNALAAQLERQREPIQQLQADRSDVEASKESLSDLDSQLSSLDEALDTITDPLSNPFTERTASVPEEAGFGVEATSDAAASTHTLDIDRLASTDTRVSDSFAADGTDLTDLDAQTLTLEVASSVGEENERVEIEADIDPVGDTNREVLEDIQGAIDTAMAEAVDDERITRDDAAQVSIVNETSEDVRFSLRSGDTGFSNRLDLNADGDLLDTLDFEEVNDVGTSETDSELNSEFTLDGVTLFRGSNTVDDALEGTTIELDEVTDSPTSFSIETDDGSIEENVEAFIDAFNGVQEFIEDESEVDPESDSRGAFAGDTAVRSIRFDLRGEALGTVDGLPEGAPSSLSEVGIELNRDGRLELEDSEALLEAAENDPEALQELFAGDDGIGTRMEDRVENIIGTSGTIDRQEEIRDNRIDRIDNRIERLEDRLERREEQLRSQFQRVQEAQQTAQLQQQRLNNFFGGGLF